MSRGCADSLELDLPRPEYPRPQLRRDRWTNLNGVWRFAFDDADRGKASGWQGASASVLDRDGGPLSATIVVPFCPQASLSGIGDPSFHDVVWYGRTFATPPHSKAERVVLHFGAVDYRAEVWVNGRLVVRHEGGHTPFSADVTEALTTAANTLVVRAEDPGSDPTIPRGKQDWKEHPSHIFYSRTTGIWQTVWLEVIDSMHVDSLRLTPNVDAATLDVDLHVAGWRPGTELHLRAAVKGQLAGVANVTTDRPDSRLALAVEEMPLELWSPGHPSLYDLTVEVTDADGRTRELVSTYFGMRKLDVIGDQLHLNGQPIFLRLVLDQGYWPGGLLTAPTDFDLRQDIELAIAMGFNGARKHQKIEDPRWLYWADRLGFLVWGEMPNAHRLSPDSITRSMQEWADAIARDYNHPSLIAWVPINESNGCRPSDDNDRTWAGVFAAHFATSMYRLTKALDATRPALSNDGWEHTESDLCTVHDYRAAEALAHRLSSLETLLEPPPAAPPVYANGHSYHGQPVVITEYGGIFQTVAADGFDYLVAADADEFDRQLASLTRTLLASRIVSGFCYTQLADVEHERNGLLTANRRPKIDLDRINAVITSPSQRENSRR